MDHEPGRVRQDIEATRTAMAEKLEMLEERTQETVENAKTAVAHTVDFNYQVTQRPWTVVGMAILAGYALRRIVTPTSPHKNERRVVIIEAPIDRGSDVKQPTPQTEPHAPARASQAHGQETLDGIWGQHKEAVALIKGAAMSAVVGLVQEMVKQAMPSFTPYCKKIARKFTTPTPEVPEHHETAIETPPAPSLNSVSSSSCLYVVDNPSTFEI